MKFTIEFNRREVCAHTRVIEASSQKEAQTIADAILEEGDIEWGVAEMDEEWVNKISETKENKMREVSVIFEITGDISISVPASLSKEHGEHLARSLALVVLTASKENPSAEILECACEEFIESCGATEEMFNAAVAGEIGSYITCTLDDSEE